jgi:hypothetical protein
MMPAPEPRNYPRIHEYEVIVADTAGVSGRRQNTNDLFAGINALFLTALGIFLIASHFSFTDWLVNLAIVLVCLVTALLNVVWLRTLRRYQSLLAARHRYIEWVEHRLREDLQLDGLDRPAQTEKPQAKKARENRAIGRLFRFGKHGPPTDAQAYAEPTAVGMFVYLREVLFGPYPGFGFTALEKLPGRIFLMLDLLIAVTVVCLGLWTGPSISFPPLP